LVRFGYDGAAYHGWARQPGLRTVEGEVRHAVVRQGVASSPASAGIQVASRTDRGVSAVGNALVLTSPLAPAPLLRALNGAQPDIFFTAATSVEESFRAREAIARVYRYFEPAGSHDFGRWQEAALRFSGEIDVRSFGRGLSSAEPIWRTVDSVTVTPVPGGALVEVQARSFVWGMVRKIVAALREVEAGRVPIARLEAALRGEVRLTLPMAEAERLVLWAVDFGRPWEHVWGGPNRHQLAWESRARTQAWVRRELLDAFSSGRTSRTA
jgi:tRNA pseudouridine38-40 synthase